MKKIIHIALVTLGLAALAASASLWAADQETKSTPKGSIHPSGDVKSADLPALAKVSFQAALNTALATVPGSVIKAELEVEDGCLMYSFEIVGANKKVTEVEIDAGNGKVLGTEDDEKEAKKD